MPKILREYVIVEPVETVAALAALDVTTYSGAAISCFVRNAKATYVLDRTSSQTADGVNVLQPALGNGRWFRVVSRLEDFSIVGTGGVANAYTASFDERLTAYEDGQRVYFKPDVANTGSSTINLLAGLPGAGVKKILHTDGSEVDAGEMPLNKYVHMIYNSSADAGAGAFEMVTQPLLRSRSYITQTASDVLSSDQPLATLSTGLLRNTTGTGVLVDAIAHVDFAPEELVTAGGVADAYTAAIDAGVVAYAAGLEIYFTTTNANTGASTLNVNGIGVQDIKLINGDDPGAGDIVSGGIAHVKYDGTNFQLLNPQVSAPASSSARELFIQAGVAEVPGKVYNSYANALVYINANGGSGYFSRWVCTVVGNVTENVTLQAYVYLSGAGSSGVLTGSVTASASTALNAHIIEGLIFDSVFPAGASTVIECRRCEIASQDNSAAAGTIYLRQNTNMYKDAGNPNISFTTLTLEVTEGSQVYNMGNFFRVNVRTGSYVRFAGNASGTLLNLYDGAATTIQPDNTTITLTGGLYAYNGTFQSSGIGFGTNAIISVNNGSTSDIIGMTTYGVNLVFNGAGTNAHMNGYLRGQAKTETVTAATGATLTYEGEYMGPQSGNVISSDDTIANILELDTGLGPALITGKAAATVDGADLVLISDDSDTGALKKVTALSIANLSTTGPTFDDNVFRVNDNVDITKQLAFEVSGVSTGTVRSVTIQDADGTMAYTADLAAYQPLDATLTALAAYNTNGILTQTAADTFAGRTITGTANEVTVTNGDGVAGNPTLSLPAVIDLGAKTSLEIPNSAAPATTVAGQLALDTDGDGATVTQGVLQAYDGTQNVYYFGSDAYPTTDGQVLTYVAANNAAEWVAASTASGTDLQRPITQAGHGFTIGEVTPVYWNGTIYVGSNASASATADVDGLAVASTINDFILYLPGSYISGHNALVADTDYFVGTTAGTLTATEPGIGNISKPVYSTVTTTDGYFKNYRGIAVSATGTLTDSFIYVGNASNTAVGVAMSGDVTITNTGVASVDSATLLDNAFTLQDNVDNTKQAVFELSSITTGTTRTYSVQDGNGTLAFTSDLSAYQPLDAGLTSISGLATAADTMIYTTALDTYTTTSLTAFARTILDDADAATVRATIDAQQLDATLTALAAYNTNGLLTQTAADTFTGRTMTGTANEITVTNGDGVAANPTFSLPAALTFTGKTVTGGTFSAPSITVLDNAFTIQDNVDATKQAVFELSGLTTATTRTYTMPDVSDVVVTDTSTSTLTNKTFDANGTGNSISNIDVADLANGTDGELITWSAAGAPTTVAVGTSGQVLSTQGAGAVPVWADQIYDIPFNAGFGSSGVKEDVAVQTYGEMVVARSGSFTGEAGYADTAPTGADLILDIEKNGTSIYTTPPEFAATSQTLTAGTLKADGTEDFVSGDRITFKITQIGSTEPGEGIRFTVKAGAR